MVLREGERRILVVFGVMSDMSVLLSALLRNLDMVVSVRVRQSSKAGCGWSSRDTRELRGVDEFQPTGTGRAELMRED